MSEVNKNLGHATAYGYAKSKGYTGTEEQFAELMASYADVAEDAAQSASEAAQSATAAAASATNAASSASGATQSAQSASASATSASQSATAATSAVSTAHTAAQTATTKASEATQSATTAQTQAQNAMTHASNAQTFANNAQTSATQAAASATTANDSANLAVEVAESIPEDYTTLSNDVDDLKSAFNEISETIFPLNIYKPTEAEKGTLNTSGGINASSYITTGYIPVSQGDVLYAYYVQNGTFKSTNIYYVVSLFDSNKTFKSRTGTLFTQSYTVPADVAYIRATFQITYDTYKNSVMITRNVQASAYEDYFDHYLTAVDKIARKNVNTKIIDCWGDSRVEMVANQGTSVCDYLQTTLGNGYNVCNYGISSQSSGMCAARVGSNEVFVTLTNNRIPASGEVQLTDIKCSTGNIKNMYAFSETAYIPCTLNGVRGRLSRASQSDYTKVKFLRDSDGAVIGVKPRTKIVVDDMGSRHHICVLWWGKNDFASAVPYVESGILDNYEKAVEYIGHDKFIILGETCSIASSYETGQTNRTYLDNINSALADKYPNNYIDINAYLSSEQALTDVGLTATATDLEYIAKGWPCYQLMVYSTDTSDTAHPNAKGREAIAHKLYTWMQDKGWV